MGRRITTFVGSKGSYPAPFAYFVGFGDSSLDFDIRAYISDINNSLTVKRDLRVAIFKRFQEEGVEIPFPQRDLHVRSAEGLPATYGGKAPPAEEPAGEAPSATDVTDAASS